MKKWIKFILPILAFTPIVVSCSDTYQQPKQVLRYSVNFNGEEEVWGIAYVYTQFLQEISDFFGEIWVDKYPEPIVVLRGEWPFFEAKAKKENIPIVKREL